MDRLKVIFLGGKQTGLIGLLTTVALGCDVLAVVPVAEIVKGLADRLRLPVYHSVKDDGIRALLPKTDLMISVHSREIIPMDILNATQFGGINVHPCLSEYKGRDPVERFLANGGTRASVGIHRMIEKVDEGEVLAEIFVDIDRSKTNTVAEVYNILYPLYCYVLIDVLRWFQDE